MTLDLLKLHQYLNSVAVDSITHSQLTDLVKIS